MFVDEFVNCILPHGSIVASPASINSAVEVPTWVRVDCSLLIQGASVINGSGGRAFPHLCVDKVAG